MNKRKLFKKVLSGSNVRFGDMVTLIEAFGFQLARVNGSHHIFSNPFVSELINIQNRGGKVAPYQIRQFLSVVEDHNLELD
jgi:predicted RNA binding protein YcfA (HicA-like mRNA interferase family)